MFTHIKNGLLFLLLINFTACSYSPASLKETYNDLASELSEDLKAPFDLSVQQSAMIDDYTEQVLQWHRRNKLPEYSQNFARLAVLIQQNDIPLPLLQTALDKIDGMPHIEQASHLTYKMKALAKSLTKVQIAQLEQSLNDDYQQELLAIKDESYTNETNDNIKIMFRFMGVALSSEQLKKVKVATKKLHDIRSYELQADKQWNKKMIALLKQSNSPHFEPQFTQLWDMQGQSLTGRAYSLEQQNKKLMAGLIKNVIMSFNSEQKEKLAKQLTSISRTFSEMVNE